MAILAMRLMSSSTTFVFRKGVVGGGWGGVGGLIAARSQDRVQPCEAASRDQTSSFSFFQLPSRFCSSLHFIFPLNASPLPFSRSRLPLRLLYNFSLRISLFLAPSSSHTVTSFLLPVRSPCPPPPPGMKWSCSMVFCLLLAKAIRRAFG